MWYNNHLSTFHKVLKVKLMFFLKNFNIVAAHQNMLYCEGRFEVVEHHSVSSVAKAG